jgi:hypothetical protein
MRTLLALALVAAVSAPAYGQSIADRIAKAPDGTAHLTFAARPGVCGDGRSIRTSGPDDDDDGGCPCSGTVRASLEVRGGAVTALRVRVGGRWTDSAATDLGRVPATDAADYFLGLAERASGDVGRRAILPAAIADSAVVWPRLLGIARNDRLDRGRRREAVFWVGQAASEAATRGLDSLAGSDTTDREVREAAVFALSQRPKNEGIPVLIRIATTNRDPDIRRKAMFWLGQSDDPRALALFEKILGG